MNKREQEEFDRMCRYLEDEGVVFDGGDRHEELVQYLTGDPIPALIDTAIDLGLRVIYTFVREDQDENRQGRDAEWWRNETIDGSAAWHSIGICTATLDYGRDYVVLTFLHELCHLFTNSGGHTQDFHDLLDSLLSEYNKENGTEIMNDYQGLAGNGE